MGSHPSGTCSNTCDHLTGMINGLRRPWLVSPLTLPLFLPSAGAAFPPSGPTPGTCQSHQSRLFRPLRPLRRRPASPRPTPLLSPLLPLRLPCSSTPGPILYPGTRPTIGETRRAVFLAFRAFYLSIKSFQRSGGFDWAALSHAEPMTSPSSLGEFGQLKKKKPTAAARKQVTSARPTQEAPGSIFALS